MSKRSNKLVSLTIAALASLAALAFGVAGCSDEGTADDTCYDYGSFDKAAPAVTFSGDVLPIFRNSCGLGGASCHGAVAGQPGQPYLGPANSGTAPTQAEIDAIFAQNVGVAATKATGMKIVEPNSPETSFLMHKMDGTLTCSAVVCDAACGGTMPLTGDLLPQTARDTVRRWIAQGAKKD
ncbi:hypothetical protein [Polyangium jinanense]|uniref:Lipoprotein n=1 Tax=Polyangium jinanense TaxID=2829994 RepID=A0A9X3X2S5_9BACT|nr:hypothetical protein [Polyangium jinanense]MDC3957262.1 hypothetical protein [Polyangium jinanense]MDC3982664.1 hypothetical protein [Polyangium jinanense]